jgi:hypothetical protein
VCAGEGIEARDVMDLMDRLVVQSLLEHAEAEGTARYRMLETIRQYGWEQLVESGEDARVLRRHRDFFVDLGERLHKDWFGPDQAEILARLRAEHTNLLTALDQRGETVAAAVTSGWDGRPMLRPSAGNHVPSESGGQQAALALAGALLFHWVAGGFLGEGRRQLERALAMAPEPTAERGRALVAAAYVAQMQFDLRRRTGGWTRPSRWPSCWTSRCCGHRRAATGVCRRCTRADWRRLWPAPSRRWPRTPRSATGSGKSPWDACWPSTGRSRTTPARWRPAGRRLPPRRPTGSAGPAPIC